MKICPGGPWKPGLPLKPSLPGSPFSPLGPGSPGRHLIKDQEWSQV